MKPKTLNELEIFEMNLFFGSFGKKNLDKATKMVRELRKKIEEGEVDLSKYEYLANEIELEEEEKQ